MRVARAGVAALLFALLVPVTVVGHAELDIAAPTDGTTVQGTPTEVAGTFTQTLKPDGSSLQLRNATGDVLATGGVDPADDQRMAIAALPDLPAGVYEVRWTTLSAEDDELARDTWSFTVVAAPTTSPTATSPPTDAPSSADASPAVPSQAVPSTTAAVTASATAAPSPTAGGESTGGGGGDALIPIIAGLALVLIAGVALLRRRGRSAPPA